MQKYIILFFSVTLILCACTAGKPNGIIKQDKMVSLLTDLHIIDGSAYNAGLQAPDSLYKYRIGKYLALFKKYNVDSAQFSRSLKYYTGNPAQLVKMYTLILARLKQKTDSVNKAMIKRADAQHPI
jgi:hypothetical protein